MPERLGFGMIGCGEIAVQTSTSILQSQSARVVCCMDVREDLAADLAGRHEASFTTSLEELLGDERVEAVVISTPHHLHAPQVFRAVEAGKHVLVEKPIARRLTEADEMIAAAEQAKVALGVLFFVRFGFPPVRARQLVRGGALGEVLAVKVHDMMDKPAHYWQGGYTGRVRDDWRVSLDKSGGGVLLMNLSHNIDAMVSILDPAPRRIYAEYGTLGTQTEVEDFVSFVMTLEGGTIFSGDGSSVAAGGESLGDRIYGRKGQLAMRGNRLRAFLKEPWQELEAGRWLELPAPEGFPDGRSVHVERFARAVLDGGELPIPARQARRSLEIVRGAYLSMQRRRPVDFPVQE